MTHSLHNDIVIRPAVPSEADCLSNLALRSKAHWGYDTTFLESCRVELSYQTTQISSHDFSFWVAESSAAVVGFYALRRLMASQFELEALFVEPAHIGKGIGRALITHAKQRSANLGAESLIVQSDPNAEGFYRAVGGYFIGQQKSASIPNRYLPRFVIPLER